LWINKNCNNIKEGNILVEKKLNIKYGINGTGKSTIASLYLTNLKKMLLYTYIKQCTLGQVVYIVCVYVLQLHILFFV